MVKNEMKSWSLLIFGVLLMVAMLLINLQLPTEVQAGPLAGFTPSPDDDDGDGDGAPPPAFESDKPEGRVPTDYVVVQLSQCDLSCVAKFGSSEQPRYEPLAYSLNEAPDMPLLVPLIPKAASVEIIAPVQIVHDGSGFIAAGALSTHHSTRFTVPYPGQWEVFLTGQPQMVTAEAIDMSQTNLAQLQARLAEAPVSMGVVQANVDTPQTVKCPLECVIDSPPPVQDPEFLPETGNGDLSPAGFLLMMGLVLVIVGITSRRAIHRETQLKN